MVTANTAHSRVSAWSGREWYFLSVLLLINTFSFLDRQVINILAEPIKNELRLGRLAGRRAHRPCLRIALYDHRPADGAHRRTRFIARRSLGVSIGVWSAFTMLCGAAQSFWQLALCRTGVGLGEGRVGPDLLFAHHRPRLQGQARHRHCRLCLRLLHRRPAGHGARRG